MTLEHTCTNTTRDQSIPLGKVPGVLADSPRRLYQSTAMSSKRKWDQAGPEDSDTPTKATKTEDGKTASEAAAAAAAIAAKIAAQFASPGSAGGGGGTPSQKDPHDADFTHDIDINDVRNRYLLTKGSTQTQVSVHIQGAHEGELDDSRPLRFMKRLVPL